MIGAALRPAVAGTSFARRVPAAAAVSPANLLFHMALLILPFMRSPLMAQNLFGIQGAKPINLLAICLVTALAADPRTWRTADRLERAAVIFLGLWVALFTVEIARSLGNLGLFAARYPSLFTDSPADYLLSYYVRPLVPVLLLFYALKCLASRDDVQRMLTTVCLSMTLLSLVIVWGFVANGAAIADRSAALAVTEGSVGFHYNTLGTFYICCGPLLLFRAVTRGGLWWAAFLLAALAVLLLPSRSGFVIFALCGGALLVILGKRMLLWVAAIALVVVSSLWLGQSLGRLFSVGVTSAGANPLDDVLTGRVDYIWLPLLGEWLADPLRFLFGAGRFAMITSQWWDTGILIKADHAHNAFVDFFLDSGIILLGVLVVCLWRWAGAAWRFARRINSPLYWALLLSVGAYLIGTPTERRFYPTDDNMLLFPMIAALINVTRIYRSEMAAKLRDAPQPVAAAPPPKPQVPAWEYERSI